MKDKYQFLVECGSCMLKTGTAHSCMMREPEDRNKNCSVLLSKLWAVVRLQSIAWFATARTSAILSLTIVY